MRNCSNECAVKDSFNFGKEVANFDYKHSMTISDGESLFNNVPSNETIN